MSLNRNLNEDSLRTLLSASGWDKHDIVEGLRLFKLRNMTAHPFYEPTLSPTAHSSEGGSENNYSFNIKKEGDQDEPEISIIPLPLTPGGEGEIKTSLEDPKMQGPIAPIIESPQTLKEEKPKKTFPAKIFSFILILILAVLATGYFFPSSIGNLINKIFVKNKNGSQTINVIPNKESSEMNISTSSLSVNNTNSSSSLKSLLEEISNLRSEFNNYKAATQSTKTIVKYISQKGPVGKAGRGIVSISATSTGFVVNYTDNTSMIIPYSTTTIINILNSNSVCFRDISSSTQIGNDICLDRESVSKLIASSTVSQH
jgi:hypothetical protein